ncbi:YopX family protein [Bacillus pumilus]|uniref:YopX family protein n=1 Tax=Bacillus pumilus TaxID=1408 RepID=UPI001C21D0F1|nr:YopX family protein [Bacillus pumilus]MBU8609194.1 YopX family protein [Bacillus pumilus]
MREIKFRSWIKNKEKFIYDFILHQPRFNHSEKSILTQYTGLKDKHGVEIYESDIAFDPNKNIKGVICYDCHQARYKFVPLSLYHSNAGDGGWSGFELNLNRRLPEVIGNIYQNPDLLEEAEL